MIKNVSSTFKANCKKDSVKYREYIVIDNKEVDIKGNLSDTAYKDTTFFGKFNLKMLKFETENDIDYKKKEFTYYKEVDGEALKIGTFIVTDVSDSDTFESVNVTAYDYGLKFANPYKSTLNYKSNKITMFQVVQEICANCDIELENTSLPNGSFIVDSNQFVNGEKYGDVICITALENGMFATINSNDKLEFIFTNETDEIIEDYVELDDKRDTQPITSVLVAPSEELATAGAVMKDQTLINQYGEHWLKIYDSYFANSTTKCQQLIGAIFNQVKEFGYSSFKSEYSFLPYLSLGDKIKFKNKEGKLVDSIILRYETNYDEMILEAPSIINASIEYELPETPEETAKKALVKVDQANGEIELIAKATEELNSKTVQLRLDVDTIEGQISDIADITTTAEGVGTLVMNNINESEPIYIKIYPKLGDVTSLYPAEDLYPKENLYSIDKTLLFHCTSEEYDKYYELPKNLLWLNNDVYDEFVLDYDNSACYVVRRVGVLEDGTKYALVNSIQEDLEYPTIRLINGDYQVSLLGQPNAYLYIRLMVQNIYTTQFATKVELSSEINQTKEDINLKVKKLTDADNKLQGEIDVQARQVVLKVNDNGKIVKASLETNPKNGTSFNVSADNINFEGKNFNLTSDNMTINSTNFSVDNNGNLTCSNANITGGKINMASPNNNPQVTLTGLAYNQRQSKTNLCCDGISIYDENNKLISSYHTGTINSSSASSLSFYTDNYETHIDPSEIDILTRSGTSVSSGTYINSHLIETPRLIQTSLKENKKNFEKYSGALDEVKNIDIYKYNLKDETDDTKKHLGFVIGDGFNYSEIVTSDNNKGVDTYSFTSLCLQAIKEQQELIENLQKQINELKESDNKCKK